MLVPQKFLNIIGGGPINTKKAEFLDWKWVDINEITKLVVDFKLNVSKKLTDEIKKTISY